MFHVRDALEFLKKEIWLPHDCGVVKIDEHRYLAVSPYCLLVCEGEDVELSQQEKVLDRLQIFRNLEGYKGDEERSVQPIGWYHIGRGIVMQGFLCTSLMTNRLYIQRQFYNLFKKKHTFTLINRAIVVRDQECIIAVVMTMEPRSDEVLPGLPLRKGRQKGEVDHG